MTVPGPHALACEGLSKVYAAGRPGETAALREVDLVIDPGEFLALRGPSGSGKSTLLALLGGLARPSAGRVRWGERVISGLPEDFLAEVRRRHFGFVFQRFQLIRGLRAVENVMLPAYPLAPPRAELAARARGWLERLGLGARADAAVERLSGGEAQRVAIARAMINDPAVLFADEPTASLGAGHAGDVMAALAERNAEGRTVVVASHDPRVLGHPAVTRVVEVADGRLVPAAPGTAPARVAEEPPPDAAPAGGAEVPPRDVEAAS